MWCRQYRFSLPFSPHPRPLLLLTHIPCTSQITISLVPHEARSITVVLVLATVTRQSQQDSLNSRHSNEKPQVCRRVATEEVRKSITPGPPLDNGPKTPPLSVGNHTTPLNCACVIDCDLNIMHRSTAHMGRVGICRGLEILSR